MIWLLLTLCALLWINGLMGNLWGRYDAREIYYRNDNNSTRSLNHKSRHVLRFAAAGASALLPLLLVHDMDVVNCLLLFGGLWLFSASVLFLVFVPVLNKYRKLERYYVSDSNNYDEFFIKHWQGEAGKVAYAFQVFVLVVALVWVWFVY